MLKSCFGKPEPLIALGHFVPLSRFPPLHSVSISHCLCLTALFHSLTLFSVTAVFVSDPPPSPISAGASCWWESSAKGQWCTLASSVPVYLFHSLFIFCRNHPQRSERFHPQSPAAKQLRTHTVRLLVQHIIQVTIPLIIFRLE